MRVLFTLLLSVFSFSLLAQFDWQHTGGPQGFPYGIYYHATTDNDFYMSGGDFLYRLNEDETWGKTEIENLTFPRAYENKVFGKQWLYNDHNTGFSINYQLSLDYGNTWQEVNVPEAVEGSTVYQLCEAGLFVRGEETELYFSSNDASTWEQIDLSFLPNSEIQYMYCYNGLFYLTSQTGQLWEYSQLTNSFLEVNTPTEASTERSYWYINDNTIYFQTETELWYSEDNGDTWTNNLLLGTNGQLVTIDDIIYVKTDSDTLSISEDFGENWTNVVPGFQYYLGRLYSVNGKLLVSEGEYGTLEYNPDNQQFTKFDNGVESTYPIHLTARGDKVWCSTHSGAQEYDLGTGVWTKGNGLYQTGAHFERISFGSDGLMTIGKHAQDTVFVSTNYGIDWTGYSLGEAIGDPWGIFIGEIKAVNNIIYAEEDFGNLYFSADFGQTFQLADNVNHVLRFNSIEFNGLLYARANNNIGSLMRSSDGGETWEEIYTGGVGSLVRTNSKLFAFTNGGLHSSNDGINWTYSQDGIAGWIELTDDNVFEDTERFFEHEGIFYYFAGNIHNFFYTSLDSCQTWLPVTKNQQFKMTLTDEGVFFGGYQGVWMSEAPQGYGELVRGKVYFDINNNGIHDTDEQLLEGIKVGVDSGNGISSYYSVNTNEVGEYAIGVMTSEEDSIKATVVNPYLESINPVGYSIATGGENRDFGIHLTPDISDLAVKGRYTGRVRPGYNSYITINYDNLGSLVGSGKIGIKLDPNHTYLEATIPPDEVFSDSLVWNIPEMALFEYGFFRLKINTNTSAELGTLATTNIHFHNNVSDNNEEDNHYILSETIVGSFDPNAKSVSPEEGLTAAQIADKEELTYTVQFQNTGTYLAETVRITDMLDTALYLPSLRFIAASHDVSSFELKPGGLLEVIFNNINLADSLSNEPESHGFVSFAVQRNENYNGQQSVKNTAAIFFDFNEPIFTNEVSFGVPIDTTSGQVSVRDISINELPDLIIYPNPTSSKFSIRSEEKLVGEGELTILDVSGKIILHKKVADVSQSIFVELKEQTAGVYNILLQTRRRSLTGQLIIQN